MIYRIVKSPGPDGIGSELYTKCSGLLAPYILRMCKQTKEDGVGAINVKLCGYKFNIKKREGSGRGSFL